MTELLYAAGDGRLVARPGLLVWAASGPSERLWVERHAVTGPLDVIERLSPGGIAGLPEFAVVLWSGRTATVVLRGVSATVQTAGGAESFDATGLATWLEREVADVVAISFGPGDPDLPLVEGAVGASAVRLEFADRGAEPRPRAESGATPPPEAPADVAPADVAPASPSSADLEPEATLAGFAMDDLGGVEESAPAESADEPPLAGGPADEFEDLFGATIVRSIEEAARRPASGEPDDRDRGEEAQEDPDHDGATITIDQLVSAIGTPAATAPPLRRASAIPRLRSSAGEVIPIDRPVIVGRSPRVTEPVGSENVPRLVSVGANPDVSRNHVRFDADGGTVVVTDLASRNGTQYTLPGRAPTRLRPGEQATLITGAVVDLGGGSTFTVEVDA